MSLLLTIFFLHTSPTFAAQVGENQTRIITVGDPIPHNWVVLSAFSDPTTDWSLEKRRVYGILNKLVISTAPTQATQICVNASSPIDIHSFIIPDNEVIIAGDAHPLLNASMMHLCLSGQRSVTIAPAQGSFMDICYGSQTPTGWRPRATYSFFQRPAADVCSISAVTRLFDGNAPLQETIEPYTPQFTSTLAP